MKKGLLLLSLIVMFTACGQKEEAPKAETVTPVAAEQVIEEVTPVAEEVTPVAEEIVVTEDKTSEVVEAVEESVAADVIEATNGEVVTETPVVEETVVVEETPVTEEKPAQ